MHSPERDVFTRGSTTYFWSSKFFPKVIREDVCKLYGFLRVADDYVDIMPQQAAKFHALRTAWQAAGGNPVFTATPQHADSIDEWVIKNMVAVSRKYDFNPAWADAFLDAMESDLASNTFKKLADTLKYTHGSAEVVGLMMSKIMGLPPAAYEAARLQGRAMQWINFIRDIAEDNALGRLYFPQEDLKKFGLKDLQEKTARKNPQAFRSFMRFEIEQYRSWQTAAEAGYHYIPRRLRLPLQTAADMYNWTANDIAKDPFIVFNHPIKPSKFRVIVAGLKVVVTF